MIASRRRRVPVAQKFEPSEGSLTSQEIAANNLRYLRKAVEILEVELEGIENPPRFLQAKITIAAREAGSAVAFARQLRKGARG